jgi:hypothetical protein
LSRTESSSHSVSDAATAKAASYRTRVAALGGGGIANSYPCTLQQGDKDILLLAFVF